MKKWTLIVATVFAFSSGVAHAGSGSAASADSAKTSSAKETSDVSGKVPVPTGKYITGGILATTVGFGIGHGIQGRYADRGWIFTATETAGLAAFLIGAGNYSDKYDTAGNRDRTYNSPGLIVAGLGVMIGFHIWEIVDSWVGATPVESNASLFLLPDPKAPGLGFAYSF